MKSYNILLFLIGMWTSTQINVIGFLGISELVIYLIAPFVYLRNRLLFKRDGLGLLFTLLFLTMVSCLISGLYNENGLIATIKGFASIYGVFACVTVLYPLIRKNPNGMKWLLLGLAISSVIAIFVFQAGSAHTSAGAGKMEISREDLQDSVTGYALFWVNLIKQWTTLPIRMYYLSMPSWYCVLTPFAISSYALISTSSGRSAFLIGMMSVVMFIVGGKTFRSLSRLRKNFVVIMSLLVVMGYVFASVYKYTAQYGLLGEKAQTKYERQIKNSSHGTGIIGMLIGGRVEFFIGATACLKHPILGCGPRAEDREGLIEYFYSRYGTQEDLNEYARTVAMDAAKGIFYRRIPAHSHIITFWLWYGIAGGMFWGYVLWVMAMTLKKYISAIPQWFGYFALIIPSAVWSIFFSPFGDRVQKSLLICCCFIVKNVSEGRVRLPSGMIKEAMEKAR